MQSFLYKSSRYAKIRLEKNESGSLKTNKKKAGQEERTKLMFFSTATNTVGKKKVLYMAKDKYVVYRHAIMFWIVEKTIFCFSHERLLP